MATKKKSGSRPTAKKAAKSKRKAKAAGAPAARPRKAPTGGGPGASASIANGVYKFDEVSGPVVGNQKVSIVHFPPRADAPPGTPQKDIPTLPETRFKKKMPTKGWEMSAEVKADPKEPVDFHIDE